METRRCFTSRRTGISAAALARLCGVTPPTMNTVLKNLQDRGLIERTRTTGTGTSWRPASPRKAGPSWRTQTRARYGWSGRWPPSSRTRSGTRWSDRWAGASNSWRRNGPDSRTATWWSFASTSSARRSVGAVIWQMRRWDGVGPIGG
ncbi:MarR family transcriptional regulator [Actinacidiphila oryziradicis]|uniref:MarR family transcriptional regulator n=1 Tax=Actinacidiphila oryziradicis TaxID=2571141 RepID=UPI001FE5CFC3